MPVVSTEFEAWELIKGPPGGSLPEIFVKTSTPNHVNPVDYKDKHGDARFVVHLTIVDASGKGGTASAVAISHDLLLTAGHNVRQVGRRAMRIEARIGYHFQGPSGGQNMETKQGSRVVMLREWEESGWEWRYDMALIKLESPFEDLIPASYKATPPGKIEVFVLGFPSEVPEQVSGSCPNSVQSGCMYRAKGSATTNDNTGMLEYKITTAAGNSGGPVVLRDDPKMVMATHSSGNEPAEINYAVRVDVDFIKTGMTILEESLTHMPRTFTIPGVAPTLAKQDADAMNEISKPFKDNPSGIDMDINLETGYGIATSTNNTRDVGTPFLRYRWHQRISFWCILLSLLLLIPLLVRGLVFRRVC